MLKTEVLHQLQNDIYCRIQPSPISGVGVFAIKRIPKGTNPFIGCFDNDWIEISKEELSDLDPNVSKYVQDMCAFQDGVYYVPQCGISKIDISFYLNHSDTPNMDEEGEGIDFIAARDIEVGEELTVNYDLYNAERGF